LIADWYFRRRGIRDRVELVYVTPLDGAFTQPAASRALSRLLNEKGIKLVTEFSTGSVDGKGGRFVAYDGREVPFDLAVVVPLHSGAPYIGRSPGLGDDLGFVPVDQHTLQSRARPNVFAIGDATALPASGAGGAGAGRDDAHGGRAGTAQVLVGAVEQRLVIGVAVDGGHEALDDAELLVKDVHHRYNAVGGAAGA
jgi:NADPH-dependent 2,4-dienoyl-CoA reductase/sulfur reductase-like enzyme